MTTGEIRIEPRQLPEYLGPVLALATGLHVGVLLRMIRDNELCLLEIIRHRSSRKGNGAAVLAELHRLADDHCLSIWLRAGIPGRKHREKLVTYYERFGYVLRPKSTIDMVRRPRSALRPNETQKERLGETE